MSKDYANKNKFTKQRKHQSQRKFFPFAGAIVVIVFFISVMVFAIHVYHQSTFFSKEHMTGWFASAKNLVSKKENKTIVSQTPAEHEEIQFDFYTELPNMRVNFPESAHAELKPFSTLTEKTMDKSDNKMIEVNPLVRQSASIKTVIAQPSDNKNQSTQFILQLGEFNDQINASQLRLSLLLAGIETEIVKLSEHKYRVQSGPYANERQAKAAERRLNKKGFEGSIKKLQL